MLTLVLCYKKNEKIDKLFSVLNKTHSFSSEKKNNGKLAFLDVLVKRHQNQFLTSVYFIENFYYKIFKL